MMGLNFKNFFIIVDVIFWCRVLILAILLIITVKEADYFCIINGTCKSDAVHLLEFSMLDDCGYMYKMDIKDINIKNRVYSYYFDNLIKAKKSETKKILIDEKNYKDLVIYFTRYDRGRSVRTLSILSWSKSLYYHELMAKIR